MKRMLLTLSIFYAHSCFAQERKEDFINKIVQIKYTLSGIDTLPGYHYLVESTIRIDKKSSVWGMKYMTRYIPKNIKEELFRRLAVDTFTEKWNCEALIETRCIVDSSSIQEGLPYYAFSKPIFDDNRKYALIQVNRGYAKSPIGGFAVLIFNKKNGKWEFLENIADNEN